mgnify:CR=1 FL=1
MDNNYLYDVLLNNVFSYSLYILWTSICSKFAFLLYINVEHVREKISDGNQEFDNMEDAMEDIPEQELNYEEEEEVTLPKEEDED